MESIKPLERINDVNCPQLEYVWKFCIEYDEKKKNFWEEGEGGHCYSAFVQRYNRWKYKDEVQLGWPIEEYDNDKYVNVMLRLYGMDKEKMWYLLLFFSDFSHGEGLGVDLLTPQTEVEEFFKAIDKHLGKKMTITLDIEGEKHKLYIKRPVSFCILLELAYLDDTKKLAKELSRGFAEMCQNVEGYFSRGEIGYTTNEKESMTVTRWYFYQMLHVFLESFGTPDGDKSQQINDLCKEFSLTGRERLTLQTDMNGFIDTMAEVMKLKNSASPLRTQTNGANIKADHMNRHYYIWHQTAEIATEREE